MRKTSSILGKVSLGTIAVQTVLACCQPAFAEGLLEGSSPIAAMTSAVGSAIVGEIDPADLQSVDQQSDETARSVRLAALERAAGSMPQSSETSVRFDAVARDSRAFRQTEVSEVFVHTRLAMPLLATPAIEESAKPLQPMSGLAVGVRPAYGRSGFYSGYSDLR